ncbi:thermonuclease family protein [Geobacillus thermocatenulatus]|uniref:thermonuclease family protein n=1 Tax=Geobacillus thermocatenulatus TaxID=33938 RepID=UPI000473E6BA|nr:thermonuclease family protein [Geobacillus thermocatenulatus]
MKRMVIFLFCFLLMFPFSAFAHPGELDELGGHFRGSDCTYLLHEPTALAKEAKTKEELVQLIQKYNGNERCKRNLTPDRIDLDGHALGGKDGKTTRDNHASNGKSGRLTLRLGRTYPAELVECIDGDTAKFRVNGHVYTTRFLFIDTPESTIQVEPYGKEASRFTCSRLHQGNILLETDGNALFDKYQRLLAWVWVGKRLLQEDLAKAGLVEDFYDYGDYKYEARVRKAYEEAKRTGAGMYGKRAAGEREGAGTETRPQTKEKTAKTDHPPALENKTLERSGHPVLYTLLGLAAAAALYWLIRRLT